MEAEKKNPRKKEEKYKLKRSYGPNEIGISKPGRYDEKKARAPRYEQSERAKKPGGGKEELLGARTRGWQMVTGALAQQGPHHCNNIGSAMRVKPAARWPTARTQSARAG